LISSLCMVEITRDAGDMQANESVCRLLCGVFDCAPDLASSILLRGRLRKFLGRATILRRGDRISTLYVVIAGRAHAIVYSLEGQAVLLYEYRAGDFFGVITPPYSGTHDTDVVAVEDVESFLLDGGVLAILAEQHGCISRALLKVMVDRLQQTASRMYEHAALSAVGRVHAELLRQARQSAELAIRPAPILSDLALRVSTTRETVSRAVNALERRGIIRRDADSLKVVAPHRLEELVL
jgi:CRP/FNR family transcriptional regulator, cyclic AMP receptor protein